MNRPDDERSARYRLGNLDLAVISDGYFMQDAGAMMGVVPRTVWERELGAPDERNLFPLSLNTLVVRSGSKTVLIDTGIGNKLDEKQRTVFFPGDYGHLVQRLRGLGVQPEEVDAVVNTHLHFDHCGWNTVNLHGSPQPTFVNATYYLRANEYEDAMQPNERTRTSYLLENYAPLVHDGRVHLVEGEVEVAPGVVMFQAPGHTRDHGCVAIKSGNEQAVYIGDMVQFNVQLERDPWIAAIDTLPLVSLETKKELLGRAAREGTLVFASHTAFPGAGHLRLEGNRRRYVPAAPLAEGAGEG